MFVKLSVVACASVIVMTGLVSQASAECLTAKGKITNNAQLDGSTLGVVALNLDGNKLKCAIAGIPQPEGGPNFKHTVVCDNKAPTDAAQAHVTFDTYFLTNPEDPFYHTGFCGFDNPYGPVSFSFEEISYADPLTVRGAFEGATGGELFIEGEYNCDGGIVMKFKGDICFSD
jgi:hypothetical protein